MKIVFAAKDGFNYNRVLALRAGLESTPNLGLIFYKIPHQKKQAVA